VGFSTETAEEGHSLEGRTSFFPVQFTGGNEPFLVEESMVVFEALFTLEVEPLQTEPKEKDSGVVESVVRGCSLRCRDSESVANSISLGYTKGAALVAEIVGTFLFSIVFFAKDPNRIDRDPHVPLRSSIRVIGVFFFFFSFTG
jgi:hypothetical protein